MKFCIIGYGSRGSNYSEIIRDLDDAEVTAVCDIKPERLALAKSNLNIKDDACFLDENDFFAAGKLADICIVSTQDSQHIGHALKALEVGYDLLLEKPIATNIKDIQKINKVALLKGAKVFVCHVLRFAPFFSTIKNELKSGEYGKISTINITENVAYWHQAHSYVRGQWSNTKKSSPMIIAKCCHDLDLIAWFFEKECTSVSSYGSLSLYKPENAPVESSDRCVDCKVKNTCEYNAQEFYLSRFDSGLKGWPVNVLTNNLTRESLVDAIEKGPYGRCVYKCDNDAVDHQVVNILFGDNSTAHLTMTAFSKESYREIHIHCERGEIYGNMLDDELYCNVFGKNSKVIDIKAGQDVNSFGHGGGDYLMIKSLIENYKSGTKTGLTNIGDSLLSHYIGFAAEKSRLNNGKPVKISKYL